MNLLSNARGRTALFTLLYLVEGAPIGFIWWALPTLLRQAGVDVPRITALTALLALPWVLKFLWAPLVDAGGTRRWGLRAWIITAQAAMGLTLLPLVVLDPVARFPAWAGLLCLHACCAATQDVAIDALAIRLVPADQRGHLNGCMQAGMLLGRSAFGGGALLAISRIGLTPVLLALVGCLGLSLLLLLGVRLPADPGGASPGLAEFRHHLRAALRRRTTWLGLAFALTGAAGFEATGQLAGPFLVDRGVSADAIGTFFGVGVVGATLVGGLVGGRLSDRWGRVRSVALFLVGFVAMIGGLAATDLVVHPSNPALLMGWLTGMCLFIGLFTAASYALFMDLTDPRLGGTQFSAFMAATNGCESWAGWLGGRLVGPGHYAAAFLVLGAASLLSLPILRRLTPPDRPTRD